MEETKPFGWRTMKAGGFATDSVLTAMLRIQHNSPEISLRRVSPHLVQQPVPRLWRKISPACQSTRLRVRLFQATKSRRRAFLGWHKLLLSSFFLLPMLIPRPMEETISG